MTAAAQFETQLVRKRQSFWGGIGRALVRNHPFEFFISGVVIVVIFGLAILAPWIEPAAPEFQDARAVLESPSFDHPFGTDNIGRDVFSRVVHGARISLRVGFASVAIGITIDVFQYRHRQDT